MARQIVILASAQQEFKDIKKYVKRDFGDLVWAKVNAEYKKAFASVQNNPALGHPLEELQAIGVSNVKYWLVRQTKIVYEFDEKQIVVHLFIGTKKDFRTHLLNRLFHL